MQKKINHQLKKLQHILFLYDRLHSEKKLDLLKSIQNITLQTAGQVNKYHNLLLFLSAYPDNKTISKLAEKELKRISLFLKIKGSYASDFTDSGLPYSAMLTRYSHDLLNWLNQHKECIIHINSFEKDGTDLNTLLALTLPSLERDETTIGHSNEDLLNNLKVAKKNRLNFLLNEFSKLNSTPFIKDHLWDSLKLWVDIKFTAINFSKSFNRLPQNSSYYHTEILKKFNHSDIINHKLGNPLPMEVKERTSVIDTIRKSLTLSMRETDPSTYMDENSLRFYELERGLSVAIYGIQPERQMALQSYIGYTLFKNGYPAAYGGSWVFGRNALFGINISEYFRGGESGFMMCQLIRVYRQAFGIDYFEVEPYQYGLDNPDGLKSGAFWFYYRYGFRPADSTLKKLAEKEQLKIKSAPGYKTSIPILKRFTESNLILQLNEVPQIKLAVIKTRVTKMIAKEFKGDRILAEKECLNRFTNKIKADIVFYETEKNNLIDVAFLAEVLNIRDQKKLEIMINIVRLKPDNPYFYNKLLSELLILHPELK